MKRISTLLLVSMSIFSSGIVAQTPFPQFTNVAISKPGVYAAPSLYTIYSSAAPGVGFQPGATIDLTGTDGKDINGIGLNPVDRYVYGSVFYGSESVNNAGNTSVWLYRIGLNGDTVNLGQLPVPGGALAALPFSGTVSTDDKYYYIAAGLTGSGFSKFLTGNGFPLTLNDVNFYIGYVSGVSALASNPNAFGSGAGSLVQASSTFYPLDVTSDPSVSAAFTQYVSQITSSSSSFNSANGGIQDIAISPANTGIYAYITYPDANNNLIGRPVEFQKENATTVKVTSVGTQTNPAPGEADGSMFDANNNFYILFVNGQTAQVDLTSGGLLNQQQSSLTTSGGNLRGDLAGYITNVALPVKIASQLSVQQDGKSNLLKWSTASEINFSKFEIQRSADNRTWSHLDYVTSKSIGGNSSVSLNYNYEDQLPLAGTNYYKLMAVDLDGTALPVGFASITNTGNGSAYNVYPNPAKDNLYITGITAAGTAVLYDASGRAAITRKLAGNGSTETINVKGLASGIYHLVITTVSQARKSFSVIIAR